MRLSGCFLAEGEFIPREQYRFRSAIRRYRSAVFLFPHYIVVVGRRGADLCERLYKALFGPQIPGTDLAHYCGLGVLYLSMLLVVTLRDGFSFLFAWEVMTLSSFVLMLFDAERREVRGPHSAT